MLGNTEALYDGDNTVTYSELTQWERKQVKDAVKSIVDYATERCDIGTELELRVGRDESTLHAYREKIASTMAEKKRNIMIRPRSSDDPFTRIIELYHDNTERLICPVCELLNKTVQDNNLDYTIYVGT